MKIFYTQIENEVKASPIVKHEFENWTHASKVVKKFAYENKITRIKLADNIKMKNSEIYEYDETNKESI